MKGRSGLNDSDKVFVVIALWIASVSLFATALTLPMLPDRVSIFSQPVNEEFSKYSNLLNTLMTLIPVLIILIATGLKHRNMLQYNFASIMVFSIMLSGCMGGVTIYGILKQFESSGATKNVEINGLIAIAIGFFLSVLSSVIPMLVHSPSFLAGSNKRTTGAAYLADSFDRLWGIGAYGYLVACIISVFLPQWLAYIPICVFVCFHVVFHIINAHVNRKRRCEAAIFDALEN